MNTFSMWRENTGLPVSPENMAAGKYGDIGVDETGRLKAYDVNNALHSFAFQDEMISADGIYNFENGVFNVSEVNKGTLLSLNGGRASIPYRSQMGVTAAHANTIVFSMFYLGDPAAGQSNFLYAGTPNAITGNTYYMAVITVDWNTGAIYFGTPFTMGQWVSHRFELINPNLACMMFRDSSNTYFNIRFYNISGTTITANSSYSANIGYPGVTRPVKCGNDGCLIVSSTAPAGTDGTVTMKLFRYTAGASAPTVYTSEPLPYLSDAARILNLVSYDGGNSKYIVFYTYPGQTETYARSITVNPDNTFTMYDSVAYPAGNIVTFGHNGMTHSISRNPNNNFLFSTPFAAGQPVTVQPAHIDENGNVTFKEKMQLAILSGYTDFTSAAQTVDNQPTMFVDVNDDGLAVITGLSAAASDTPAGTPVLHRMYEIDLVGSKRLQYLPFNNYQSYAANRFTRCMLFPSGVNNPSWNSYIHGLYLIVDQYMLPSSPYVPSAQQYYYQDRFNLVRPDNIIGVALEGVNTAANTIKAQTTAKILKGLYTNLVGGLEYMAGSYGSLVPYDGVGVPVGRAVNATDFAFYGFKSLN